MLLSELYKRAETLEALSLTEALLLWNTAPLDELMAVAHHQYHQCLCSRLLILWLSCWRRQFTSLYDNTRRIP